MDEELPPRPPYLFPLQAGCILATPGLVVGVFQAFFSITASTGGGLYGSIPMRAIIGGIAGFFIGVSLTALRNSIRKARAGSHQDQHIR